MTDSAGRFALADLPSGSASIAVRRLGFSPVDTTITLASGRTDSLALVLEHLPQNLPGITTTEDDRLHQLFPEFYRHRLGGVGHFFDRHDIAAMHALNVSDVVRSTPGWHMAQERSGRGAIRSSRGSGGCPPDVWVDGVRADGLNPDDVSIGDVEAVELYRGPAGLPPELNDRNGRPGCGIIVIWTRSTR